MEMVSSCCACWEGNLRLMLHVCMYVETYCEIWYCGDRHCVDVAEVISFRSPGAVAFKRASLAVVRAEGAAERTSAPTSPMTTPPGSDEFPLGVISSSAPLEQGADKPVGERIAYVCQDCGYVYDEETPFEDVPDDYNCPRQSLARFISSSFSASHALIVGFCFFHRR